MAVRYITAVDLANLNESLIIDGCPGEKRILVEGDSWVSYPRLTTGNLASYLEVPQEMSVVVNLAWLGERMIDISRGHQFELYKKLIHDERLGYKWDLLFLVGGVGDLFDWIFDASVKDPGFPSDNPKDYVDQDSLRVKLDELRSCFKRYIDLRNSSLINHETPILVQTYDYLVPRNQTPTLLGHQMVNHSWILPKYEKLGIRDPEMQKGSMRILLDGMAAMLKDLAKEEKNFHVADTRGTLEAVPFNYKRVDGDWRDEIHPSTKGYQKLTSQIINPMIQRLVSYGNRRNIRAFHPSSAQ